MHILQNTLPRSIIYSADCETLLVRGIYDCYLRICFQIFHTFWSFLFAGEYSNSSHGYQGDFQDTKKWSLSFDKVWSCQVSKMVTKLFQWQFVSRRFQESGDWVSVKLITKSTWNICRQFHVTDWPTFDSRYYCGPQMATSMDITV